MIRIVRVMGQTPIKTVPSKFDGNGERKMSTIMAQEPGTRWADSFAITLFGDLAEQTFSNGELVMVAMKFSARENGEHIFQDIVAEELIRVNQLF